MVSSGLHVVVFSSEIDFCRNLELLLTESQRREAVLVSTIEEETGIPYRRRTVRSKSRLWPTRVHEAKASPTSGGIGETEEVDCHGFLTKAEDGQEAQGTATRVFGPRVSKATVLTPDKGKFPFA